MRFWSGKIGKLKRNCSRRHFDFVLFCRESKACGISWTFSYVLLYFMWIVCLTENSHEIPGYMFYKKQYKLEQVDGAPSHILAPAPSHIYVHNKIPNALLQSSSIGLLPVTVSRF